MFVYNRMYTDSWPQYTPVEGPPTQDFPRDTSMEDFQMTVTTELWMVNSPNSTMI